MIIEEFKRMVEAIAKGHESPEFNVEDGGKLTATFNDTVISANTVSSKITVRWDIFSNRPHMAMIDASKVACHA